MVNLFGKGFIGSQYTKMFPCIVNERNDLTPKSNEILYLISTTDNHTFRNNPYIDIETNLTTLMRVLEKCSNSNTTFNFVSSWFVYGKGNFVDEDAYCDSKGFYSITKRTAEQLLIEYAQEFNIQYRILRLGNVIGNTDKHISNKKNILGYLVDKIKKEEYIELHNNGDFLRTYIHVEDVCSAINLVLSKGKINEIYNIGAYSFSLLDAVSYVIKKTGSKTKIINIPNQKVSSFSMNMTKINNLGFVPKYTFTETLDKLINEYN